MKLVLITGLKEADKKTIAKLVLQRVGPGFRHVDIDNLVDIKTDLKDSEKIKSYISTSYKAFEKDFVKALKKETRNVLMTGSLSLETVYGYYPILSKDFFKTFAPDVTIHLEIDTFMATKNPIEAAKLKNHQLINRHFVTLYTLLSGGFFRVVKIEKDNVMESIDYISNILKEL
jgi:adenylate kinase